MKHPFPRLTAAVFALTAATLVGVAGASTSIRVGFEPLVRESNAVAFVTPMTHASAWERGRIVTYTDVHVDARVAGRALPDHVAVRTLGGDVGRVGQVVEGEAVLTLGQPSLLFLRDARGSSPGVYAVTARAQGEYAVVADADGTARVKPSPGAGDTVLSNRPQTRLAAEVLHDLPVADVPLAVTQLWSRVHAP
jgi:hypothetical protein